MSDLTVSLVSESSTHARLTEAVFQRSVVELAQWMAWRCYHTFDSRRSTQGYPDLTLVREDRLIFAELKSDRGRLSKGQRDWLQALEMAGAEAYVWRPRSWGEILETLKRP